MHKINQQARQQTHTGSETETDLQTDINIFRMAVQVCLVQVCKVQLCTVQVCLVHVCVHVSVQQRGRQSALTERSCKKTSMYRVGTRSRAAQIHVGRSAVRFTCRGPSDTRGYTLIHTLTHLLPHTHKGTLSMLKEFLFLNLFYRSSLLKEKFVILRRMSGIL